MQRLKLAADFRNDGVKVVEHRNQIGCNVGIQHRQVARAGKRDVVIERIQAAPERVERSCEGGLVVNDLQSGNLDAGQAFRLGRRDDHNFVEPPFELDYNPGKQRHPAEIQRRFGLAHPRASPADQHDRAGFFG